MSGTKRKSSSSDRTDWRNCQRQSRHCASVAWGKSRLRMRARKMLCRGAPVKKARRGPAETQFAYVPMGELTFEIEAPVVALKVTVKGETRVPAVGVTGQA